MPYAMLPRGGDDDIDLEEFLPALKRRFTWVPSQFKRYLSRPLVATFLAFGIAALFLLGRSVREGDAFEGYSHLSVTYDLQLDTVRKDGIETLPSRGASIARWPNDYPMAAAYMQKNSIIRDVQDPWPEKPYIANTWCGHTAITSSFLKYRYMFTNPSAGYRLNGFQRVSTICLMMEHGCLM